MRGFLNCPFHFIGAPRFTHIRRIEERMFDFEELEPDWGERHKTVRLIELPRMVVFPHVIGQFRFYEERHVRLLEDAVATDRFVAVGTQGLEPGSVVCLCRVVAHQRFDDGAYAVLMVGVRRLRLCDTALVDPDFDIPTGWVAAEICEEPSPLDEDEEIRTLRNRLETLVGDMIDPNDGNDWNEQLRLLFSGDVSLGSISDILASMFEFGLTEKRALLTETVVERRAARLLHGLGVLCLERLYDRLLCDPNNRTFARN